MKPRDIERQVTTQKIKWYRGMIKLGTQQVPEKKLNK
jgi:hypothetical protein